MLSGKEYLITDPSGASTGYMSLYRAARSNLSRRRLDMNCDLQTDTNAMNLRRRWKHCYLFQSLQKRVRTMRCCNTCGSWRTTRVTRLKNCTRKVGSRNIGALGRTAGVPCTLLIKHISRHLLRSADHFSDRQDTNSGTHHRIC